MYSLALAVIFEVNLACAYSILSQTFFTLQYLRLEVGHTVNYFYQSIQLKNHSFYFYQIFKLFTYICSCLIKKYLLQVHSGLAVRGWPVGPNGEHHSSWRGRHRQRRNLH